MLLEAVHAVDLHHDVVAETDDLAGVAAGELTCGGIEDVEVIRDRGERHDAAVSAGFTRPPTNIRRGRGMNESVFAPQDLRSMMSV